MLVKKKQSDKGLFLKRFIACPTTVGSIIPSSSFLTHKMIRKDELKDCISIAELGAGTGIFTNYILKNKPKKCNFYIFEKDPVFSECLQSKFPGINIYSEASHIGELVRTGEMHSPDMIISGIPFAVLNRELRMKILRESYNTLKPGGKFITFQYSTDLLSDLKSIYSSVNLELVLLNIPPAIVYRCTK